MLNLNQPTSYDQDTLPSLKHIASTCELCTLCHERTHVVFGTGPAPCDLMIIGEAPGEQEDLQGNPFVGRSGKLLTSLLQHAGINRETQTYITNIVKCRPPNNRNPRSSEIAACTAYLIRQINLVQPKILVLLGSPSLKTLLQTKLPITKVRGQRFEAHVSYMKKPLNIIPLFHPSYLLRFSSVKPGSPKWLTLNDIKGLTRQH